MMLDDIGVLSLVLLGVFLLFSAFFSGSEAALLSVQRIRIRHMADGGVKGAARVSRMVERPEKLLPPILLGNNLVNSAAVAVGTAVGGGPTMITPLVGVGAGVGVGIRAPTRNSTDLSPSISTVALYPPWLSTPFQIGS